MKQVFRDELTKLRMAAGNEDKYDTVIDGDMVKEWVGIGWITVGRATQADREVFPHVVERPPKKERMQ